MARITGVPFGARATNTWQAVLVLDGDGSSGDPDAVTPLPDGHYQIAALTTLRDAAGNALGQNGLHTQRASVFSRDFNVVVTSNAENPREHGYNG